TGALAHPGLDDALRIVLHEIGGIGIGAIDDDLHLWMIVCGEIAGEGRRNDYDAAHFADDKCFFEFTPIMALPDLKIARRHEAGGEILGERRHRLDDDADAGAVGIERDAIAEQEQEDQRQDEGDQDAARIADDLIGFLAHQSGNAPCPAGSAIAHGAASASEPRTRAMKASSIDGSGLSREATRAFTSSGEPSAIDLPR